MSILHDEKEKVFYIERNGKRVGEITYIPGGEGKIAINHTYVDPKLRGEGLAKALTLEVVKYARENNYKILPICSYSIKFFKMYDNYSDVVL